MEHQLTHFQTLELSKVLEIGGDLLLLPEPPGPPYEEVRALREGRTISVEESILVEMTERIEPLYFKYEEYRLMNGEEPAWLAEKPISVQRRLRYDYATRQEEALANMGTFPHTGLSYMVREGGLCEALCRKFDLWRLQNIKQLGFLQSPWDEAGFAAEPVGTHHRFGHSLDVMTIASVIGYNLGLDESSFNTLRMAALTHDMGTPAGGDSVKLVDMQAFDEDWNYHELLARHDWADIREEYHIDHGILVRTILNRGLLGQILDIADKLAYVARDLQACMAYIQFAYNRLDQYGMNTLLKLLQRYPNVCSVWDSVRAHNGQMVIMDPARLGIFLKVRTLLFRELYTHPNARFGEYLISRVLVKTLYMSGRLTRDQLLSMTDYQLNKVLDEEFGVDLHTCVSLVEELSKAGTKRKTFHTRDEAVKFYASLKEQGNPFVLLEDTRHFIKTGTHFKVMTDDGPQAFAAAFPGETRELDEMAQLFPSLHVYYLEGRPNIKPEKYQDLVEAFASTAP